MLFSNSYGISPKTRDQTLVFHQPVHLLHTHQAATHQIFHITHLISFWPLLRFYTCEGDPLRVIQLIQRGGKKIATCLVGIEPQPVLSQDSTALVQDTDFSDLTHWLRCVCFNYKSSEWRTMFLPCWFNVNGKVCLRNFSFYVHSIFHWESAVWSWICTYNSVPRKDLPLCPPEGKGLVWLPSPVLLPLLSNYYCLTLFGCFVLPYQTSRGSCQTKPCWASRNIKPESCSPSLANTVATPGRLIDSFTEI